MTFDDFQSECEQKIGASRPSEIASELGVTTQVVSNWKARNQVPYKYVQVLRTKIEQRDNNHGSEQEKIPVFIQKGYDDFGSENQELPIEEIIIDYLKVIKSNYKLIITVVFLFALLSAIHVLYFVDPIYHAHSKVISSMGGKNSSAAGKIGGIASQFGLQINSGSKDILSNALLPEIIRSRRLARKLLVKEFDSERFGAKKSLLKILTYGHNEPDAGADTLMKRGIDALLVNTQVYVDKSTSLTSISISSFEPQLAVDILNSLIHELGNTLKEFKVSRIREKRIFIESRVSEIGKELVDAEELLKKFRERNRNNTSSPSLLLEMERLQRTVDLKMQIYTTLRGEQEMAQIEEVEQSRMIEIVEYPEAPIHRSSPNRRSRVLVASMMGGFLTLLFIFSKKWYTEKFKEILHK